MSGSLDPLGGLLAPEILTQFQTLVDNSSQIVAIAAVSGSEAALAALVAEKSTVDTLVGQETSIASALTTAAYTSANETVTSGAISVSKGTTFLSVTGTQAYTLADGTFANQVKTLICTVAASTPAGTVTPANPVGFSSVSAFDAVGDTLTLQWTGTKWVVIGSNGVTINA